MATSRTEFTGRDYSTIRSELLTYIERTYPTLFNDMNSDHVALVLLEAAAYMGDGHHFYLDYYANEGHFPFVSERKNIASLVQLVGYTLRGKSSAEATLTCSQASYAESVLYAKGEKLTSSSGVTFEVKENTTVPALTTSFTINVVQGDTVTDTFSGDGYSNQAYLSTSQSVVSNVTPTVTVNSVSWTVVENLFEQSAANVVEGRTLGDLSYRILFGDGVHGNIPAVGANIKLSYLSGGGPSGNIAANSFNGQTIPGETVVTHAVTTATVVSSTAATGGENEESVSEAKNNAKASLSTKKSLTNTDDYKAFCESYSGVLAAHAYTDKILGKVYMVLMAPGYTTVAAGVKASILADITSDILINITPEIEDVIFVNIVIQGTCYIQKNYNLTTVSGSVQSAIAAFFHPTDETLLDRGMGDDVYQSDISAVIDAVTGVDHVDFTKLTRELRAKYGDSWSYYSTKGTFSTSAFSVGTNSKEGEWRITFFSETQFTVLDPEGVSHTPGTIDVSYTSDNSELSFKITSGSTAMEVGDYAKIRTSKYVGNIVMEDTEFARVVDLSGLSFEYTS